ncbi:MAG: prepilin-type N-terminal cleavage/methylation domain-containing protein [Pirellulales bacterium]
MKRAPHGPHSGPSRAGLSLVEVLISMFVMTIGLLGLAALIPVGQAMMSRGAVAEQKAIVGRQALREFKVQGLLKPPDGLGRGANTAAERWVAADPRQDSTFSDAYCFDPLAVARHGAAAGLFPAGRTNNSQPWMVRVWPWGLARSAVPQLLAERLCMAQDDLVFERPDNGDQRAFPVQSTSNVVRTYEGNFSWFATAVRDPSSVNRDMFTVSIAVCHRRPLGGAGAIADLQAAERVVAVDNSPQFRAGGDGVMLSTTLDLTALLKPGYWIMLASAPNGGDKPSGYFRWYRIQAASSQLVNGSNSWMLSLAGPKWPEPVTSPAPLFAIIPEGVVGVYERTMRVERPSPYNGWR